MRKPKHILPESIADRLRKLKSWDDIYKDPELSGLLSTRYSWIRSMFEDSRRDVQKLELPGARIIAYLSSHGNPAEYDIEELAEKYVLLDWIACQLVCQQPLKL